jgi:hypothetical protein
MLKLNILTHLRNSIIILSSSFSFSYIGKFVLIKKDYYENLSYTVTKINNEKINSS